MSTKAVHPGQQVARTKRKAVQNPIVEPLARMGYVARGIIYFLIGYLAAELAFMHRGETTDPNGAIAIVGEQPFGTWLLLALAVGLLGYSLWGFVRAIFDPLSRGHDLKGLVERVGFLVSGVSYSALALVALYYATGFGAREAGKPQDLSAQLLSKPFGPWLVGLFGIFWIAAAIGQLYLVWTASFEKDFRRELSPSERTWAERFGQFGYAARGIVFAVIGWFVIQAALHMDPNKAVGLDGALAKLTQEPYGMYVLGIVALGLVAFGIFSAMCGRWVDVVHPARK